MMAFKISTAMNDNTEDMSARSLHPMISLGCSFNWNPLNPFLRDNSASTTLDDR